MAGLIIIQDGGKHALTVADWDEKLRYLVVGEPVWHLVSAPATNTSMREGKVLLATHIRSRHPNFLFFDHPNNLGFAKSALSHLFTPSKG